MEKTMRLRKRLWTICYAVAGICFLLNPFKSTVLYMEGYPHLIGDRIKWAMGYSSLKVWKDKIHQAQLIKENTNWGDIVLVPNDSGGNYPLEGNPIEEYYAQRRYMRIGDNVNQTLDILRDYKSRFLKKEPRVVNIKFWIWLDINRVNPITISFVQNNFRGKRIEKNLYLYQVNS